MLKLICGPSGSGKTAHIIEQIKSDIKNQTRCFLLVPEQQAYISERDLYAILPQNAGLYLEVVNFSRLAEDVFKEYGGIAHTPAHSGIRTLLMWDTIRSALPLLKQYGKGNRPDLSLTVQILKTVDELRINAISSEDLENAAAQLPVASPLAKKLFDLSLVEALFSERTKSLLGEDPSDRLLRMAQKLQEHPHFAGCHIYIDSFTSFTAEEYTVLSELMRQADCVTVSLCADQFHSKLPHFESTVQTANRLTRLADRANIETEKTILSICASKPKALEILERDLWRFDLKKEERSPLSPAQKEAVCLTTCANLYEEAEATALHIAELVQGGMHYGEIAVVVRDTETYCGVLDAALDRYNIPYFLSKKTDLSSKPLARLILSSLRAVSHHYQAQDILTLLKTNLTEIDLRDIALFEEYCETWHINGSRFADPLWSMNPDGLTTERSARASEILDSANSVRASVMKPLQALESALRASPKLSDRCKAIYDYLILLNVPEQLSNRAKKELLAGQKREAGETVRLYRFLIDTLTALCTYLPDTELTTEEFTSALTLLFSATDLGSVPNINDCVIIGSASTLRVENIKAALLLGLCEGEFPKAISDDGILSENDKATMESLGLSLSSREQMLASEELLYVYRAITKPTEKLYLSTVLAQPDGTVRTPSLAFKRAAFVLDQSSQSFDFDEIRLIHAPKKESCTESERWKITPYPPNTILRLSQSKIRDFLLCPYRYYSIHQLKLREKKDSVPSYADDGTFLHYVFEHFLRASTNDDRTLHLPSDEEIPLLADQIIEQYLCEVCPLPPSHMDSRLLHLFARLRKLSIRMLQDILGELRESYFVPSFFEQGIGLPGENGLPPMILPLKNGSRVMLSGKIDRVDVFEQDDKTYVRIVDYKSGKHSFSLEDVESGMDIQLVLYLFSAVAKFPNTLLPAGAQYLYASGSGGKIELQRSGFLSADPSVQDAADQSEDRRYTKKLLSLDTNEIYALEKEMKAAVVAVAERVLAGEAQKTPSEDACGFCPVRSHCDKAIRKERR